MGSLSLFTSRCRPLSFRVAALISCPVYRSVWLPNRRNHSLSFSICNQQCFGPHRIWRVHKQSTPLFLKKSAQLYNGMPAMYIAAHRLCSFTCKAPNSNEQILWLILKALFAYQDQDTTMLLSLICATAASCCLPSDQVGSKKVMQV